MTSFWPTAQYRCPIGSGLGRAVLGWALGLSTAGLAQTPAEIYRCGNAYTNQPVPGAECARMGAASVTVIEGTRVHATAPGTTAPTSPGAAPNARATPATDAAPHAKVDAPAQKERDQQARQILEAELAKAIAGQAEIARLWNNGEPHKQGDEFKNPAKYQQRVAELRMGLMRSEADIAGLRRELARLGTVVAKP
jgi:hypothetical protein